MEHTSGSAGDPDRDPSTTPSVTGTASTLSAAIAALKEHRYDAAIAQFEQICQTTPDQPTRIKAQMGLIKAYGRTGDRQSAIALCQPLCDSPIAQVRQWATQTLASLDSTVEAAAAAMPDAAAAAIGSKPVDQTGFMPLEPEAVAALATPTSLDQQPGAVPVDSPPDPASSEEQTLVEAANPFDVPLNHVFSDDSSGGLSNQESTAWPTGSNRLQETGVPSSGPIPRQNRAAEMQTVELSSVPPEPHYPQWQNAPRAARWAALGKVDHTQLWGVQIGTAIATGSLMAIVLQTLLALWNQVLSTLTWPIDLRAFRNYGDLVWIAVLIWVALLCASPWLMDWVLRRDGAKSMSLDSLRRVSPEAATLLRRVCGNQQWPLPALRLIPTQVPLIMSYGHLPRYTRLAISQGLLNQLPADEIAALIAAELGHMRHWAIALPSAVTLLSQGPYLVYRGLTQWGDGFASPGKNRQIDHVLQALAVVGAGLGYGLYRLLRLPGLWLSRLRASYGDRTASELTGNPNGLTRALMRVTLLIAQTIEQQQTHPLLESMSLLLPVDGRSAISMGGLLQRHPTESVLQWDCVNPYRQWLSLNSPLPTLGDRLKLVGLYARHWRLQPELELDLALRSLPSPPPRPQAFWGQQAAPYVGIAVGSGIGLLLWGVGAMGDRLNWSGLSWMWRDGSLLQACMLLGFSIGMLLRINPFYPDIKRSTMKTEAELATLFCTPTALPVDGQPIQLQGTLIGCSGLANRFAQDLYLKSSSGLIRLHLTSPLGSLGMLVPPFRRFLTWMGTPVTVTGWYRRGLTAWIDVSLIQPQRGAGLHSQHPQYSTLAMAIAALMGLYLILTGG